MGSSRWKRFPFFERNTLFLPDAVTLDMITPGDSDAPSANGISLSVVNGAGIPIASIPDIPSDDGTGVSGMLKTLICTGNDKASIKPSDSNLNIFQFSNSGKTLSLPSNLRNAKGNVDGSLVLAFLSSRITERVHCVDLTVRCNPLHKIHKSSTSNTSLDEVEHAQEHDFDGWRGYFSPFIHDRIENMIDSSTSANSSTDSSRSIPKVIGVAACSDHDTEEIKMGRNIYVACITDARDSVGICIHRNPHLYLNDLSSLLKKTNAAMLTSLSSQRNERVTPKVECFQPPGIFDQTKYGKPNCVDIRTHIAALGTDKGVVLIYHYDTSTGGTVNTNMNKLSLLMEIYPPHTSKKQSNAVTLRSALKQNSTELTQISSEMTLIVSAVKLILDNKGNEDSYTIAGSISGVKVFVTYNQTVSTSSSLIRPSCGVCCFDLGVLNLSSAGNVLSSPSARYDLDGRQVADPNLCDVIRKRKGTGPLSGRLLVARSDGLYTYSTAEKLSVSPIDGSKTALCSIPSAPVSRRYYQSMHLSNQMTYTTAGENPIDSFEKFLGEYSPESGASYVLIATTDSKSGRDVIDIYDTSNKLVAFHLLLSPGCRSIKACGVTTAPKTVMDNNTRGGLSSAVLLTSRGSIVTFTEKVISEKVSLLVQKNLYGAAISMAFSDPLYQASDIALLFRRHAEHLYRKGDYAAAMDQYILTIGSFESSHVIFRYLDAPKLSFLTKYLEALRSRNLASSAHLELLKTCYTKLNECNKAEQISFSLSKTMSSSSCNALISNLLHNPTEALATLCAFDAPQAADALKTHGTVLAKCLPKETAGVVISLCDGLYSPTSFAELGQGGDCLDSNRYSIVPIECSTEPNSQNLTCALYPVSDFSSAFLENPKILLVILAHCHKNKRHMDYAHKRMLLELTLEDWNAAKKSGDLDRENIRKESALGLLSDTRLINEIGDYEALVIVEEQQFDEGIMVMYEKLQMTQILLEKYAEDGSYVARRKMLAMCRSDPELLANVLGYLIDKANSEIVFANDDVSISSDCTNGELLDDIREGLSMARSQNVLPPVRVARILAGDGIGQFPEQNKGTTISDIEEKGVPLSVALEYIGDILDDSSKIVDRLKNDVEEYDRLCNSMANEISELLSNDSSARSFKQIGSDIDEMYTKLLGAQQSLEHESEKKSELFAESFWREMNHSSDRFETLARFFAKDILD